MHVPSVAVIELIKADKGILLQCMLNSSIPYTTTSTFNYEFSC